MFWFAILIMYVNIVRPPKHTVVWRKSDLPSLTIFMMYFLLLFIQAKFKEKIGTMHQLDIKNFLMFIFFVNLRAFALPLRLLRMIFFVKVVPLAKKECRQYGQ